MTEFLYDIISDRENILTDFGTIDLSVKQHLARVRDTPLEDLDNKDKR